MLDRRHVRDFASFRWGIRANGGKMTGAKQFFQARVASQARQTRPASAADAPRLSRRFTESQPPSLGESAAKSPWIVGWWEMAEGWVSGDGGGDLGQGGQRKHGVALCQVRGIVVLDLCVSQVPKEHLCGYCGFELQDVGEREGDFVTMELAICLADKEERA